MLVPCKMPVTYYFTYIIHPTLILANFYDACYDGSKVLL